MKNDFIVFYFKNLIYFLIITSISFIITLTINKISNKNKSLEYEISNIPVLKLKSIVPNNKLLLELLVPGKTIVTEQGVFDQKTLSAMDLMSISIFKNLITNITEYSYKKKFLNDNPEIFNIKIKSNYTDYALVSFEVDINNKINNDILNNFLKISNLETKKIISSFLNKDVNTLNIENLYIIKSIDEKINDKIDPSYIFIIFFTILHIIYYLIFQIKKGKIKLKLLEKNLKKYK